MLEAQASVWVVPSARMMGSGPLMAYMPSDLVRASSAFESGFYCLHGICARRTRGVNT
jgi:hypothetical protein